MRDPDEFKRLRHGAAIVTEQPPDGAVLVVGRGDLADTVETALNACDATVSRLQAPNDAQLHMALEDELRSVVLVSRDDIQALRLALLVEHLRPGLLLIVTIFGRTVADQLTRVAPECRVISMADASVPALTAACLDPSFRAVDPRARDLTVVESQAEGPRAVTKPLPRGAGRLRRSARWLRSQFRPLDIGSRMLLVGAVGLALVFLLEAAITGLVLDADAVEASYVAAKTIATVGPNPQVDGGPGWFQALSAAAILVAVVFSVLFTAGLVNRLLEPRLIGIFGSRTIPRSGHVVVVGLGQVGLRLCLALRELGLPVVAVERDPNAPNVRVAQDRRLPVVIGHGGSRFLLRRLSTHRARALAAVTSDDSANVAISVAALAANPAIRVVLRAGDGELTAETQSLFHIGVALDVVRLGAVRLALAALGESPRAVFTDGDATFVLTDKLACRRFPSCEPDSPAKSTVGSGHDHH